MEQPTEANDAQATPWVGLTLAEQTRLLDLSNDAIIVRDIQDRIIYWNHGATELYGWTRAEVIGQDLHTLLRTEFEVPFPQLITLLHQQDQMEGEVVQVTRDGRRITTFCRWALDRDAQGRPGAILTTYNDITERTRADHALRVSEASLRRALTIATVGVIFFDLDGSIRAANAAFLEMSGYSQDDLHTGRVRWDEVTPPEFMAATLRSRDELRTRGENTPYEKQYLRPDGSRWWGLFAGKRLSDTECIEFVLDITARKQAEAERERLLHAEQTARAEAEAALKTRDHFLSIASHELRTPLTSLIGYAYLLPRALTQGAATVERMIALITRQAQRLDALIDQLLDVSRLQRGLFVIAQQPVELATVVAQVVDDLRAAQPVDTRHTITLSRPDEPVLVLGDDQRLEQVIVNLLTNAVKYSPAGGTVAVRVQGSATEAIVDVADPGIGIPAEAQDRLFEPFFRANNVGEQISGFGIGLHLVREIVQRHAGRIEVESQEGQGSTFRVVLPRLPHRS